MPASLKLETLTLALTAGWNRSANLSELSTPTAGRVRCTEAPTARMPRHPSCGRCPLCSFGPCSTYEVGRPDDTQSHAMDSDICDQACASGGHHLQTAPASLNAPYRRQMRETTEPRHTSIDPCGGDSAAVGGLALNLLRGVPPGRMTTGQARHSPMCRPQQRRQQPPQLPEGTSQARRSTSRWRPLRQLSAGRSRLLRQPSLGVIQPHCPRSAARPPPSRSGRRSRLQP